MTAGMEHRIETLEANGAKAADAAAQTLSATKAEGEAALNKAMEAAEAVMTSLEVWMDKRAFLLSHFDLAKNDHFAKTGWGLTQGKAGKRGAFLQASRAEEKRLTDVVAHMEAEAISAYRVRKRPSFWRHFCSY